tara:strand:+ start:636 stop:1232 length:597 start_codon:yes stop_codon:yes gene_type:complete
MYNDDDINEVIEKINLDDLYEKKKVHDIQTTNNYNKILNRVHTKIRTTARMQLNEQYCWFLVPEMMLGVPKYNQATCISYIIDKLQTNGFITRYTHPNMLFISWSHWVPSYVRDEIKKKTGVVIDGYGNIIKSKNDNMLLNKSNDLDLDSLINTKNYSEKKNTSDREIKDISSYKPSGNLIYNKNFIESIKNTINSKN